MTDIGISLESVTLDYPIYDNGPSLFSNTLISIASAGMISANAKHQYVRALDNISINLRPGDSLGIIGGNGAGKTTLLKTLAGIFHPSNGRRLVSGRIATLLSTGFGLDEDCTGYENITLGGITLGFTRKQISERILEISEFTELGNFLNLPLRAYSAGMRARLAFAISTAIYPDILIIDEGIGAGDKNFYDKARKRFEDFSQNSKILVLASHDDDLLERFCNKSIVMHHGQIKFSGPLKEGLSYYKEKICVNP